jgi:hypothetical protein
MKTEDGRTHRVDLVVKDEQGTQVGVKVDQKSGVATFVGHDGKDKRATALANRIAQRYAYSKVTEELKRKGYQIAKEEKQKDARSSSWPSVGGRKLRTRRSSADIGADGVVASRP